jgi:hypothetical protein
MSYKIEKLDQAERARQKQARRDRDNARLDAGEISPTELNRENGFFSALPLAKFKIVSIGGRPFDLRGKCRGK